MLVSGQASHHIGDMSLSWEQLCALAAGEIEATLEELPEPLRVRAEKLPVIFERHPNAELQADGIEADTLGLFTGAEFADEENVCRCRRRLFCFWKTFGNLRKRTRKFFVNEVRTTFLHELGHYLGLDEDELTRARIGITFISWAFQRFLRSSKNIQKNSCNDSNFDRFFCPSRYSEVKDG